MSSLKLKGTIADGTANEAEGQEQSFNEQTAELGITGEHHPIRIVSIIGQIEGHTVLGQQSKTTKYEHLIPMITEVEQSEDAKGMLILMNTVGGDVEAGLAIAELIRGMSKPTVSLVLGGGHSIGVPLAVSADYSFIAPTASMTIHPLRTTGLFITVPQSFAYFNKMQERIIRFVCENSKIEEKQFKQLMYNTDQLADDTGTVLIGKQTVDAHLIDAVGGLHKAITKLNRLIDGKKAKANKTQSQK